MARALVVGGGIGGLATAIALRAAGVEVAVFERANDLRRVEVGAGITLWPNAVHMLDRLGVGEEVRAHGFVLDRFDNRTRQGRMLMSWSLSKMAARLGAPTIGINRPDLHATLAAAAGDIRTSCEATGWDEDRSGVTLHLFDGRSERGDVLIGADGIDSMVRARLLGDDKPRYAGLSMWRANLDRDDAEMPDVPFAAYWGRGTRFVYYRTARHRLSWEGVVGADEGDTDPADGRRAAALERFAGWSGPATDMVSATKEEAILRMDVHDRPPCDRWGAGRATLLGDAAHAMTFAVGQGAAQALEDAVTLADSMRDGVDPAAALRSYEARRKERAARFQATAWRLARVGAWTSPVACALRDATFRASNRVAMRTQERQMRLET